MAAMGKVEVLRAACCVAGVDGTVSDEERKVLAKLAGEIGVGQASLTAMIQRAESDKRFWNEQFRVLKTDPKDTMEILFRVACSDGKFRKYEMAVLKRLAERLEVPEKTFNGWVEQVIRHAGGKNEA